MFLQENLYTSAALFNSTSYGVAPAIHTYTSSTDTLAAISAFDYFPNHFNVDPLQIRKGDILFIIASDFNLITKITSVSPVVLVAFVDFPTNIVTDSDSLFSVNAQGIWASPQPIMVDVYQQNKLCILTFPNVVAASTGGALISFSSTLPTSVFPQYAVIKPIYIEDNSLQETGLLILNIDGTVRIVRANSVAFDATGNAGFLSFNVTYKTV